MFQSVTVMILSLVQIFPSLVNESPFILNPVSFWQNHLSSKVSLFSGLAKCLKTIIPYISCPGTLSKSLSHIQLFAIPWTVARLLSMEFSRQECWSGLPFPSPGDLPDPGIEHGSAECLLHCRQILLTLRHWGSPTECNGHWMTRVSFAWCAHP